MRRMHQADLRPEAVISHSPATHVRGEQALSTARLVCTSLVRAKAFTLSGYVRHSSGDLGRSEMLVCNFWSLTICAS